MKLRRFSSLMPLAAALALGSCSGLPQQGGGGGGTATLSVTMVADTPPANPSLLSFEVTITGIDLTPASGAAHSLPLSPQPVVDLIRLQSDSVFLGSFQNIPAATYSSITVSLSSLQITFLNDTSGTISGCLSGQICKITPAAAGSPQISLSPALILSAGGQQGLGIDFNLNNAISISGGNLTVNFSPAAPSPAALTTFTLPRLNSNLGINQLDLIEDFTGVVSLSGQNVTITSPTRGTITANITSNSFFDPNPDTANLLCPNAPSNCAAAGQVASVDVFVNADGTLSIKEYEPLLPAPQDIVEGIVVSIDQINQTQFSIVTTHKVQAAQNSLIAGLQVGDPLALTIIPFPNPFLVDTKGLPVPPSNLGFFAGTTNNTVLRLGQTVAVHVTTFTAASGNIIAAASADTVILRWSRFTATASAPFAPSTFKITGFPSYFNLAGIAEVQTFTGTPGTDGVTNLEGITSVSLLTDNRPVALRALFIQNSTDSAQFPFFAAKVRQH